MSTAPDRVGFIGLGKMGGNMALRLLECGAELVVTDVNRDSAAHVLEAGATWADSAAEVASRCSIVLSSLPGPAQVEQVALGPGGIAGGIQPGSVYVDLSTSSPSTIARVREALAPRGVAVLDAPVSGSPQHCREGSLAIWIGGDEADIERARPVLAHLAREVTRIGGLGAATVAKLVNNAVGLSTFRILSEVMSLGVKAGIDHHTLLEALKQGAYGRGLFLTTMIPVVAFRHAFTPAGFTLGLAAKDLALATTLADELDVPMPIISSVLADAQELIARGHADEDTAILFALQEERAGVRLHDDDVTGVEL